MQPEYCTYPAYQILESFCKMMNIGIRYGKTPDNSYAIANVESFDSHIVMNDLRIESGPQATRILGHEIGHFLVERFYNDSLKKDSASSHLIELQCDQIGNALYLLAERIVDEAEGNGEDLCGFINRAITETMERDNDAPAASEGQGEGEHHTHLTAENSAAIFRWWRAVQNWAVLHLRFLAICGILQITRLVVTP